jgi:PEP-CTERM motif
MKTLLTIAGMALALAATTAEAATFNFHYRSGFNVVSGQLTGTLQGDANTLLVDSVVDFARVGGVAGPALPFVYSSDSFYGGSQPAFVTIDGSAMSLLACATEFCELDGFVFDTTENLDVFPFFGGGGVFDRAAGDFFREVLVPGNWSLAAVPEPGTWLMLVAGFGVVGIAARRRPRVVAA